MIHFLSPGFAWALAAPALVLVLYLLRRRFLPRQVPSVFLWRRSVRENCASREAPYMLLDGDKPFEEVFIPLLSQSRMI